MKRLTTALLSVFTLLMIYAQSFRSYTASEGLPSNNVLCLASDLNGVMWFGTQKGIAVYDGGSWEVMNTTTHPGLANDNVSSILIASNGDVWAGGDFGLSHYSGDTWTTYTTTEGLGSNRITNLTEVSNGDIWISDFNGATHYDGSTFTAYKSADGLPFGGVEDVVEMMNGDLVMATGLGGLAIYDGADFTLITENNGLVSNNTTALAIDDSDNLWVGTASGISVFSSDLTWKTNHTRMYIMPEPDTLNPVEDIVVDANGDIWTGIYVDYLVTVGGVAKFDGLDWTDYDQTDGMVGPTIRALAVDENDAVWVATSSGVTVVGEVGASVYQVSQKELIVYPNPTRGSITVQVKSEDIGKSLNVYNTFGQVVFNDLTVNSSKYLLDMNQFGQGTYTLIQGDKRMKLIVL